ncbi:MAG: orange carotenoid protein N-terminal domain-containing protein, partial [Microcystaceae cyanobacterium]
STDITREYGSLTNNTKLALWYQLAQGMENSEVIQVPSSYQLSPDAKKLLSLVEPIGFEQQYVFLRDSLLF